jgi:hypothetical protein
MVYLSATVSSTVRLSMVDFTPSAYQPEISVRPCGCVVTAVRGHTHVKFCAPCKTAYFERAERCVPAYVIEPNNLDLIGG